MKNKKLFMPNRQIFMAGPEAGGDVEKQPEKKPGTPLEGTGDMAKEAKDRAAKLVGAGMQGVEALDTDKPKVEQKEPIGETEMKQLSKGYPEVALNQNIIAKIKEKFASDNKDKDKEYQVMHHRDTGTAVDGDGYEYVLVMDENHQPHERLFKSKDKQEQPKEDPTPVVAEFLKTPYSELDKTATDYSKYANMLRSKVKSHGDAQSYIDANNVGYVLLKDDNAKDRNGLRVFKGAPV